MRKIIKYIFLFIFIQLFSSAHAQFKFEGSGSSLHANYSVQNWTKNDGLPSNTLYNILLGDDDFLWIGTSNGLVRFDGREFKTFTAGNTPEIKANIAADLFKDSSGSLWFTNGGAGLLRMSNNHFTRLSESDGLTLNHPSSFAEPHRNKMFIGTFGGGLNIYENKKFSVLKKENGLSSNDIHSLLLDKNNRLWIGTYDEGINLLDKNKILKYPLPHNSPVENLFIGSKGILLAGTHDGIFTFTGKVFEREVRFDFLKGMTINHIDEDGNGNLWISTNSYGIFVVSGNQVTHLNSQNILSSDDISQVLITKTGVWICSLTDGLSFLKQNKVKMLSKSNALTDDNIRTIYQAPGGLLWIGTNSGLATYNEQTGECKKFISQFSDLAIHAWATDVKGTMFLGSRMQGLFTLRDNKLVLVANRKTLRVNYIRSLKFDELGTLWIGTNGAGVVLFSDGKPTFINKAQGLASDFVACLCEDRNHNFWVGTSGGGISVVSLGGKILKTISDKDGLANNIINSIIEDEDGTIWVATSVSGISRIKDEKIFNFNDKNGLYSNTIKKLLYDKKGNFWATSEQGIFTFTKKNLNDVASGKAEKLFFKLLGKKDGMLSDKFNAVADNAGCIAQSGKIYAPSNEGVVIIDPEILKQSDKKPGVFIDDISVNNKEIAKEKLDELDPSTETIQINYGGISYSEGEFLKFKYMLEGIDYEWMSAGHRRQAFFTHLPHGKYTFKVKAVLPDGTESPIAAEIHFTIHPYFWQTFWFQSLATLFLLSLFTAYLVNFYKRKYRRKVQKIEMEAALERERMRISKDMHDELGATLTKITLMSDLAKRNLQNPAQLKHDLESISGTSRSLAATMDEIVWAVNPKNDTLEKTIFYFIEFLEEYLSPTTIQLKLNIPDEIPDVLLHSELRHNLFLVIKEAVTNVIKHSGADLLRFKTVINHGFFLLFVEDNGKGIRPSEETEFSNGLANMKKRIEDVKGSLLIHSSEGKGTTIEIKLPFS